MESKWGENAFHIVMMSGQSEEDIYGGNRAGAMTRDWLHTGGLSKQGDLRILGAKFLLLELAVVNVEKEKTRMNSMALDKNWMDRGELMVFNM